MKDRNIEIDTLRGIACLFLVAYHVVGDTPNSGLRIENGLYRDINDLLIYIRMPLFTFLSGVVYAYRPFKSNIRHFILGKCRRLLLPLLVVGTTFAIIQANISSANSSINNWYLIHIIPVAHFWFIEAIFIIFMIIIPLELGKTFENK